MHTTKSGKQIRLAWRGGQVVEAKNLKTGKVHTEAEFKRDLKRRKKRMRKLRGALRGA